MSKTSPYNSVSGRMRKTAIALCYFSIPIATGVMAHGVGTYCTFLRDTGRSHGAVVYSSPGIFASYRGSRKVSFASPAVTVSASGTPVLLHFASPSQQGRTISYSTSLAVFWALASYPLQWSYRESCAGPPVLCKHARLVKPN